MDGSRCVASATSDLATQGIFEMSTKEDPNGDCTVGVITKCDVTQHPELVSSGQIEPRNMWLSHSLIYPRWYVLRKTIVMVTSISRMAGLLFGTEPQLKLPITSSRLRGMRESRVSSILTPGTPSHHRGEVYRL